MNRIEKRAIEALAIAPVIREISHRLGKKEALEILRDINQKEAFERGRNMAKEAEGRTMEFLVEDVATWGTADFVIYTRDGSAFPITLDALLPVVHHAFEVFDGACKNVGFRGSLHV